MIKRIINYIKNNNFTFKYFDNKLNIVNYEEISIINDKLIIIKYNNNLVMNIRGINLSLTKLLDKEILINGQIKSIEM